MAKLRYVPEEPIEQIDKLFLNPLKRIAFLFHHLPSRVPLQVLARKP